jgi:hypothetical protein
VLFGAENNREKFIDIDGVEGIENAIQSDMFQSSTICERQHPGAFFKFDGINDKKWRGFLVWRVEL